MKGIVFTEFIEMVETRFSPDIADRMLDETELPSGGAYTAVGTYAHEEMVALVGTLARLVAVPGGELVKAFGEHLFARFAQHYPVFFTPDIDNAFDFLVRIEDVIHVEVRKLYPDAELPRFEVEARDDTCLQLRYESNRHLGDLAEGLIRGCIRHYGESIALHREALAGHGGRALERFVLTRHA